MSSSGIRQSQRDAALTRDGGFCSRCGRSTLNYPSSLHHRLPRGRGGTDRLSNLALLCGSGTTGCHGAIESHRADAYREGFILHTGAEGDDPQAVPVLTWSGWRHLMDSGESLSQDEYHTPGGAS